MTLAVTRQRGGIVRGPALSARRTPDLHLGKALGILADAGLVLSLVLVLTAWGTAGIAVGLVLGCVSIGSLVGSLVAMPLARSSGRQP